MGLSYHTVFLLEDGTVRTVGQNNTGQLGTGTANTSSPYCLTSLQTPPIEGVKQVSCGSDYTVFLMEDGTVKTVGQNNFGQCGTGNTTTPQLSLYTPPIEGVKQVSCGYGHTVFLLEDGTVRTVGRNDDGQCGTGDRTTPQLSLYTPNIEGVKQVSCGYSHTVFLLEDGTVRTVGYNAQGQCGTGDTTNPQLSPATPPIEGVKQVACGYYHTVFLLKDGTVRTVGLNSDGQLATGVATPSPYYLTSLQTPNIQGVKQVSCGSDYTVFLMEDGTVKTVGQNNFGQCGTGNTSTPQLSLYTPNIQGVKQVACGYFHTVFLLEDGTVRTVGYNNYGQCGTGNTTSPQLSLFNPGLTGVKLLVDVIFKKLLSFLFRDGLNIKSFIDMSTIHAVPPTQADFETYGVEQLPIFTEYGATKPLNTTMDETWTGGGSLYKSKIPRILTRITNISG